MHFWRLNHPDYSSDYEAFNTNGDLRHPYALPGIKCSTCGNTWGGSSVLPFELPEPLRVRPELTKRSPIPSMAHRLLRAEVAAALAAEGMDRIGLQPGQSFQPATFEIPTRPVDDFLWGGFAPLLSRRIHDTLTQHRVTGIRLCPARPGRVGLRSPSDPIPLPASGEPEDLLTELATFSAPDDVPPYWEMVLVSESGPPPGVDANNRCTGCGRLNYDRASRQLAMRQSMWPETDVFLLATTLWIVVTDRVKDLLDSLPATNVTFQSLDDDV